MTLMLSTLSAATPAPPPTAAGRQAERAADTDAAEPESFSQTLARSCQSGQEKAGEPAAKMVPPKSSRRLDDDEPPAAPGTTGPMAALRAAVQTHPLANDTPVLTSRTVASAAGALHDPALPVPAEPDSALADAAGMASETLCSEGMAVPEGIATLPKETGLAPAPSREIATRNSLTDAAVAAVADPHPLSPPHRDGASLPNPSSGQSGKASQDSTAGIEKQTGPLMAGAQDTAPVPGTGLLTAPPPGAPLVATASAKPAPASVGLLAPDVGSPEWSKALGQQVIHLSAADRQTAELQLNPPGLGPLKVMLSLNDQQIQVAFVSAQASVRVAVEMALPQLRAMLAESGISLGQTSVGAESQSQTSFGRARDDGGGQPPRAGWPSREAEQALLAFSAPSATIPSGMGRGLRINTYA